MGSRERKAREKAGVKEKILEAAREMFTAHGFDKVSMRMIAEKIEYSPTAIYLHFKDKQALFDELCRQDFQGLAQAFRRIARIEDPVERLRHLGHTYVEYALQHPSHYRLMFMTPHPPHCPDEGDQARRGDPNQDAYAFLKACIADCVTGGRFRPELTDLDLLSQAAWAALHGVVSLNIALGHDDWMEWRPPTMTAQVVLDGFIRGLLRQEQKHG